MPDAQPEFYESDFGRAVFLSCQQSVSLVRVQPLSAARVSFVFSPASECQRLIVLYATDQIQVPPRQLLERARALKGLLHQAKNAGGPA